MILSKIELSDINQYTKLCDELFGSVMGILCQDTVGECRPFVVLENLIVSPKYRKMGLGKRLIIFIEDWARENNSYFVMFMSLAKRTEAHAFYESLGYSQEISSGFKKYL